MNLTRPDTIRYYERAGPLPAPQRTSGDHRRYEAAGIDRLRFIRGGQRLGLRLAEIRELLAVRTAVYALGPSTSPCGRPARPVVRSRLR